MARYELTRFCVRFCLCRFQKATSEPNKETPLYMQYNAYVMMCDDDHETCIYALCACTTNRSSLTTCPRHTTLAYTAYIPHPHLPGQHPSMQHDLILCRCTSCTPAHSSNSPRHIDTPVPVFAVLKGVGEDSLQVRSLEVVLLILGQQISRT